MRTLSSRYLSLGLGRKVAQQQASRLDEPVDAAIECETFHKLENCLASNVFLATLKNPGRHYQEGGASVSEQISEAMLGSITDGQDQIEAPDSSEANDSSSMAKRTSSFAATTSADDFVVVDRQSAIESMAFFIAETLMSCPQAASLPPDKLQEAVLIAVQSLKQSKFKQLCTVGRHAYRWTALGYSAFQMYSNPWIMQAIIRAIFALSRMTLRDWV